MNSEGSTVPGPGGGGGSSTSKVGLGVGLGVGLAVALAIVGVGVWLCLRRRRKGTHAQANEASPLPPAPQSMLSTMSPFSPKIGRKRVPVSSAATESELSGAGVVRELSGRDIHPFPDATPSPPVVLAGQHEVMGDSHQRSVAAQGHEPGQHEMLAENRPQEMIGSQSPRYELWGR